MTARVNWMESENYRRKEQEKKGKHYEDMKINALSGNLN